MSGRGKGLRKGGNCHRKVLRDITKPAIIRKWKKIKGAKKAFLSFSLQKDQLSGDDFLLNDFELPSEFKDRYGPIPRNIYIRRCYKQLYDITAEEMSSGRMEWDKRFALQFREQTSLLFKPAPGAHVYTCSHRDADSIRNKNFLVLCDINNPVEPASRAKWLVIFSTPNPARYKECMKNAPTFRYTLPTWSEQELTSCDSRVQLWYDNLVRWGGVPRHVLSANNA
eukprot:gene36168-48688_t